MGLPAKWLPRLIWRNQSPKFFSFQEAEAVLAAAIATRPAIENLTLSLDATEALEPAWAGGLPAGPRVDIYENLDGSPMYMPYTTHTDNYQVIDWTPAVDGDYRIDANTDGDSVIAIRAKGTSTILASDDDELSSNHNDGLISSVSLTGGVVYEVIWVSITTPQTR